jgi:hypothetical protein
MAVMVTLVRPPAFGRPIAVAAAGAVVARTDQAGDIAVVVEPNLGLVTRRNSWRRALLQSVSPAPDR